MLKAQISLIFTHTQKKGYRSVHLNQVPRKAHKWNLVAIILNFLLIYNSSSQIYHLFVEATELFVLQENHILHLHLFGFIQHVSLSSVLLNGSSGHYELKFLAFKKICLMCYNPLQSSRPYFYVQTAPSWASGSCSPVSFQAEPISLWWLLCLSGTRYPVLVLCRFLPQIWKKPFLQGAPWNSFQDVCALRVDQLV